MLDTFFHRSAVATTYVPPQPSLIPLPANRLHSTAILPRAPKSSSYKPKKTTKIQNGSAIIANWQLALIIIGSIIAACLIAYAAYWFYKRRQAKKAVSGKGEEDEEAFKPGVNGPGEERDSLEYTGAAGRERYEDGRRD
jgi:hypothetical protein